MSNLSQNKDNAEINECSDEIRVQNKENSANCVVNKVGMMGGISVDCELNEVYESQSMNENECDKNSSDKLDKECLDNSVKECLDNIDKLEKENDIVNISCTNDNKQNDGSSIRDHSNCDRNETSEGSKGTYASATKNSGWFESNKMFVMPTVFNRIRKNVELDLEFKEIVDHGMGIGCLSLAMNLNGVGRTEYARVLVEIEASKGFKELVELQYRDKNMNVKVRVRTDEEIAVDREEVDKNLENHKEDNFMQNKVRKPIWNTRVSKQGLVNYSRNNCMSGEGPKRRSWEGDREKERNERLDRMEGFVEGCFEETE
ncbi:hypothetical protein Tco_0754337 [Tanacetum coccineum]